MMNINKWDIIENYLNYADQNGLNADAYMYEPSESLMRDGTEKWFLIVNSWEFIDQLNQYLNDRYSNWLEEETGRDWYEGKQYFSDWLDFLTEEMWGFSDEHEVCDCCNKAFPTRDSIEDLPYWIPEEGGVIYCPDCVEREYAEDYAEERLNNPRKANQILSREKLTQLGFCKVNDCEYENGWYGTMDDPKEILAKAIEEDNTKDYLFSISSHNNPFATFFDLYAREKV